MSIRNKLILSFGLLIGILVIEITLNQIISNDAAKTYQKLKVEAFPAMKTLEKYEATNRELFLLISTKTFNRSTSFEEQNRLNGILDVELPFLKSEIALLKGGSDISPLQLASINSIIQISDGLISKAKRINGLFLTKEDYKNASKMAQAKAIYDKDIPSYYADLSTEIVKLLIHYNELLESYQNQFTEDLKWLSNIILITGVLGVLFGLLVAFQVIRSISKPIERLKEAAQEISTGNYEVAINIDSKDEIARLATSFNKMAKSLKESFEEIEENNIEINLKNKELEEFAYIASHDLQEPLRTVTSFIDILKEEYGKELEGNGEVYVNFIFEAAVRMRNLISALLDYSKLGRAKEFQDLDCKELVKSCMDDLSLAIRDSGVSIEVGDLPKLRGSEIGLRVLFQNLISNAIKFRKLGAKAVIEISASLEPEHWVFCVKDNGIGIEKTYLDKIFIIFQRLHTKEKYEGTGIGLAHCRKIVEIHNGRIWVESEENVGSSFYFTIPV
ncbi:ATP-binding protein [uncultured Arcticibacterium sp.]|uniref:ATP-binding protein n=1 Tax=uncultured Arcticibacterium sp. TaxID=2173042 RepID=UPI0030F7FC1B